MIYGEQPDGLMVRFGDNFYRGTERFSLTFRPSPLSTYSVCEQTWIEGRKYFDLEEDRELRDQVATQRARLVQKILNESKRTAKEQDNASEKSSGRGPDRPDDPNRPGQF